jgi:cation diffusion facilitator family transporter
VLIGGALAAVAVGLAWQAVDRILAGAGLQPTWVALVAAVLSCVVKELLYHWTIRVGRRINSPAVVANAVHHRTDAISSIPATVAVTATLILGREWWWIDPAGAIVVSAFILYAAWTVIRPAIDQLVDRAAPLEEVERLRAVLDATPGVDGVHDLRTRYVGTELALDVHIEVHPELTVRRGHEIADTARDRLYAASVNLRDVVIHVDPTGEPERDEDH